MSILRITPSQAQEVERLKGLGRTDRQIEKFFGFSHGALRNGYELDHSAEIARASRREMTAEEQERFKREIAAIRADLRPRTHSRVHGWRPKGDCVSSRPDSAPLRTVPRASKHRGAV